LRHFTGRDHLEERTLRNADQRGTLTDTEQLWFGDWPRSSAPGSIGV
jgi:hypothetical protein